ncbi:MAG: 4-hydroxy-3-methylbut-2-enyl diphosphate reductase [Selenomonadaceae bacterium]|nr:4-hydroxy-3-methylbut-2-enyl diphosphate reductase [Selenomonadaceae bacterium]
MEVIFADHLGFCYGVKRAIHIARQSAQNPPAYTLGSIIHNPQMVERLKSEGIGVVENLDEVSEGTIIIRSHGVAPKIYDEIRRKGLNLIDATCPHVKKAQLSAKSLVDEGYQVVIIGEKNHPEVKSIFEWSDQKATIIESESEAQNFPEVDRLGIVSQTTFSRKKFSDIVLILLEKSRDMKILRTICDATEHRQIAAIDLASKVDLMLVIGGKNSANTSRLASLCAQKVQTYHVETAAEIDPNWFKGAKKIGITAGASTPDWVIEEAGQTVLSIDSQ